MNWGQKKQVVGDTNEACLYVLEFYYSKMGVKDYTFDDDIVGRALGLKRTTIRDRRLRLEKAGYFKQVKTKNSNNESHILTILGHEKWIK